MTTDLPHDVPALLDAMTSRGERRALSFYRGKSLVGTLTYAGLVSNVYALASELRASRGIQPGDRIAVLAANRIEIPVLILAILRLGAVVVPLNPGSASEDWAYILDHCEARGLCTTRDLAARVPAGARDRFVLTIDDLVVDGTRRSAAHDGLEGSPALDDELAVVLYTSGTTGNPKGVALRQRNLLSNAASMANNFGLMETPQLAVLPLYHAHAFGFGLMTALATGGHLVFSERLEPFTWAHVIRAESVAVTSVVPTLLPMLLAAGVTADKVPTLRHIMVSSAPLSVALARSFEEQTGIPLVQGWGLSEYTNFACCVSPRLSPSDHAMLLSSWEVPSIGTALAGTEVRVVDEQGGALGERARGELQVRGHSTMLGYLDDPEGTTRAIDAHGWLHTGDEGFHVVHEGKPIFFVTGRLKEIIIRDAEKYAPLAIERRLAAAVPGLAGKLVILGFEHREHGEEVGAYVEDSALDEETLSALTVALEAMPLAERPKVVLVGSRPVPRTHTGKIQRRKMQPWFADWLGHRGPTVIRVIADPERSDRAV